MRPEVKVGLFVGFVAIAGFAIWWFSKSTDELGELPFDKAAADATSFDGSSLPNSDSKAKPKPTGNSRRSDTAKKTPARNTNPQRNTRSGSNSPGQPQQAKQTPPPKGRDPVATPSVAPPDDSLFGNDKKQPTSPPKKSVIEPPARKKDAPTAKREEPIKKEETATPTNTTPPRPQPTTTTPPPNRKRETEPRPAITRPSSSATTEYTIQDDDTLIHLARDRYGEDRYWHAIKAANPGLDERRMQIGQKIKLPTKAEADRLMQPRAVAAPKPGLHDRGSGGVARATYVVGRGDTLTKIARNVLGDESRYLEIFELNRDKLKSPDLIQPGMELKVPARAASRSREPRG